MGRTFYCRPIVTYAFIRIASTGFKRAAIHAGTKPEIKPINALKPIPTITLDKLKAISKSKAFVAA